MSIEQDFDQFKSNIEPTQLQIDSVSTSHVYLRGLLQSKESTSDVYLTALLQSKQKLHVIDTFLIGSYIRRTMIRPIEYVDILVKFHYGNHENDSPSRILQLLKTKIQRSFPDSVIKKNSPCVVAKFKHCNFELVPGSGFADSPNLFKIPNFNASGWVKTNPQAFATLLSDQNKKQGGKLVPLIKMLKNWKRKNCAWLKSFHLEYLTLLVFLNSPIRSYPEAIKIWFEETNQYLRSKSPFLKELSDQTKYLDAYLYGDLIRLLIVRKKLAESMKIAQYAYNLYLRGYEQLPKDQYKKLFSDFPG